MVDLLIFKMVSKRHETLDVADWPKNTTNQVNNCYYLRYLERNLSIIIGFIQQRAHFHSLDGHRNLFIESGLMT